MSSVKLVVKVWDADRLIKKSFLFTGDMCSMIEKANAAGVRGSKLVLESDGTEVDDPDIFQYFGEKNEIFQLLPGNMTWVPAASSSGTNYNENIEQPTLVNVPTSGDIINWINTSDNGKLQYVELPISPLSNTVSMSSGRISSLNSEKSDNIGIKSAENLFSKYQIPLNKLPEEVLRLINEQKPLGRCYTDFVHLIVSDMRQISFYIPQTIFRKVAINILEAFPKSVGIVNSEGELISDESIGLATKLLNHNNYLNRNSKQTDLVKPTKRNFNISEGITNFYNKGSGVVFSDEEGELKRIWLKEHHKIEITNEELRQEIITVFNDTYSVQRKHLMNNPKITEIQQHWPHLLEPKFLIYHFINLINIEEHIFFERWEQLKLKTFAFFYDKYKSEVLRIITRHFKENLEIMIRQYDVGTTQNEIESLHATPCFAIINDEVENYEKLFYFLIENRIVSSQYCSVRYAILQIVAAYFVFNMEYPTELSQTLEVLQRICLDLNTNFSRSKKQKLNNKAKIVNFLKHIL